MEHKYQTHVTLSGDRGFFESEANKLSEAGYTVEPGSFGLYRQAKHFIYYALFVRVEAHPNSTGASTGTFVECDCTESDSHDNLGRHWCSRCFKQYTF